MSEVKIFYIAGFKIDLSRSVVIKNDHQTPIEPKVLKVLLLLAQRQNEVVTHKEIKEHVWHDTEVVPNALQRCIAILRKVLGDDAKAPTIIATHPRIGYSLLAEVNWEAPADSPPITSPIRAENTEEKEEHSPLNASLQQTNSFLFVFAVILLVTLIGIFWPDTQSNHYTQIEQLTQTDAHESHTLFSPDAKYLIFNRYAGSCKSHLWAKHQETGKESQLTEQAGHYGEMSFTSDGRELVFAANKQCDQLKNQDEIEAGEQECWSIATLDFAQALSSPKKPELRYQCQADSVKTPKALANHKYAFLQYENERYQLVQYDDLNKSLSLLYSSQEDYIYHFDYDPLNKRFVIISRDKHFNNIISLIDDKGALLAREQIQLKDKMSQYEHFSANFAAQGEYLLATINKRLYKIALSGQMQLINTPEANLISVVEHPKKHAMLAVKGEKDIDIAKIILGETNVVPLNQDLNGQQFPFTSLARSAAQERNAMYQPSGELIAFISDRSGNDQIWLWHQLQEQASQLTFGSSQRSIHSYSWSPDGTRLSWIADDQLTIADLSGSIQTFNTNKPLFSVLSWYRENQLIVLLNDPVPGGLYRLELDKNELIPLGVNLVEAAWVHQNQLIYSNVKGEVFSRSLDNNSSEIIKLPKLNGKALFIHEQLIYSVDKKTLILNQYNLEGQLIKAIMPLKATAWKVTGLKDNELLLSQFIAINQDIVMLK